MLLQCYAEATAADIVVAVGPTIAAVASWSIAAVVAAKAVEQDVAAALLTSNIGYYLDVVVRVQEQYVAAVSPTSNTCYYLLLL